MAEITEQMCKSQCFLQALAPPSWQGELQQPLAQLSSCLPATMAEQGWLLCCSTLVFYQGVGEVFLYQMGKYREIDGGEIPGNSALIRMA